MNAALDAGGIDVVDAFDVVEHRLTNRVLVGLVRGGVSNGRQTEGQKDGLESNSLVTAEGDLDQDSRR